MKNYQMQLKTILVMFTILVAVNLLIGQDKSQLVDPLQAHLLPPELIMEHQQAIGLTGDQRTSIIDEIGRAQVDFNALNWSLRALMEQFVAMLSKPDIEELEAIEHFQEILLVENKIKSAQMTLMIRLKNYLTEEQQIKLKALRD